MSAPGTKLRQLGDGRVAFRCPGCENFHVIVVSGPTAWGFNGDGDKPTFTPSVLVTGRDFTPAGRTELDAWRAEGCPPRNGKQFDSAPTVCHSFVTDGRIQFLTDCSHALAGKTVDLPDWEDA